MDTQHPQFLNWKHCLWPSNSNLHFSDIASSIFLSVTSWVLFRKKDLPLCGQLSGWLNWGIAVLVCSCDNVVLACMLWTTLTISTQLFTLLSSNCSFTWVLDSIYLSLWVRYSEIPGLAAWSSPKMGKRGKSWTHTSPEAVMRAEHGFLSPASHSTEFCILGSMYRISRHLLQFIEEVCNSGDSEKCKCWKIFSIASVRVSFDF